MIHFITTTDDLVTAMDLLRQEPFIALDTEFIREETYYSNLCLIQLAYKDTVLLIDPLVPEIDLSSFYEILQNPSILKVFHSCRQDLEIFYTLTGKVPTPLFDTQVAAMVLGYGESVGLETLVNSVLQKPLDKSQRYSNWALRPLKEMQLEYAAQDVIVLLPIFDSLYNRLKELNRLPWIEEELQNLQSPILYQLNPLETWKKIRLVNTHPRYLGRLQALCAWRDQKAELRNIPRSRILKDDWINDLAQANPLSIDAFSTNRLLKKYGFSLTLTQELLDILEKEAERPDDQLPHLPPKPSGTLNQSVHEALRLLLKVQAHNHTVADSLIVSSKSLEAFVRTPSNEASFMKGWRYDIFGQYVERFLKGDLCLTFDQGQLIFEERKFASGTPLLLDENPL